MLIHVPELGTSGLALNLSGELIFEARSLLFASRGADKVLTERVGVSLLALSLQQTSGAAWVLYATQKGLQGMSGAAWDLLSVHFTPDVVLVIAEEVVSAVLKPVAPPRAVAKPKPANPIVEQLPDPYPGLTRNGETWPQYLGRTHADRSTEADNRKMEWTAAGQAFERGGIGAWVDAVGASMGFRWEAPAPVEG